MHTRGFPSLLVFLFCIRFQTFFHAIKESVTFVYSTQYVIGLIFGADELHKGDQEKLKCFCKSFRLLKVWTIVTKPLAGSLKKIALNILTFLVRLTSKKEVRMDPMLSWNFEKSLNLDLNMVVQE